MHLQDHLSDMKTTILYWVLQIPFLLVLSVVHFVLGVVYRGKGKAVPPAKNSLLLKSASTLAQDIREGKCKSEDVIQAYIDRISEVEPYINATVDNCFEDALKKAREVDSVIASRKYSQEQLLLDKPLLGIPISIKSVFHVKNLPCTAGCLLYKDLRAINDAPAVALLKKAGAIIITTTNVPELALNIETHNKLYGRTCNPYDTNRVCGGSSGGEAALLGAGASLLGLGNDLLGSLRIPAHFCGIYSHKPSRGLVPNIGSLPMDSPHVPLENRNTEFDKYLGTGPMCRYAVDLITSMKILSSDHKMRRQFDHQFDLKKLKIYYLTEIRSPLVAPVDEGISVALQKAVSYFEKQYNISAEEVKMPYLFDVNRCVLSVIEPIIREIKASTIGSKGLGLNEKLEFFKALLGKSKLCLSTLMNLNSASNPLVYRESLIPNYRKMMEKWIDEFNNLLDENTVLLLPTLPITAPYHSETFPLFLSTCYTSLFNVLGLPVTHCPLGLTDQGLPRGIQIVGRQNNDPLTIACAVALEKAFGGWKSC